MNLLICGSREASPAMLDYARRCVYRALEVGHSIIVGDASGVDTAVVIACLSIGVPCTVYGIYDHPRCFRQMRQVKDAKIEPVYIRCEGDFLARDRVMAEACDLCIGIHNGISRGTAYTVRYAQKLGKEAHLRVFDL